ncbi:uncharacterized protein LOC129729828 [Wyeomyia smithii]|uniref:uncharacterized protein LOC129729828 n=1 Tax=Wyeomyia smithii TaxID=174621 RepID=UPI002467CA03|nr:uncharacterized protein LOC129729828 [Wyeomyia smithii]
MSSCVISEVAGLKPERDNPVLLGFQNAEMGYKDDTKMQCFRAEDTNRATEDSYESEPHKSSRMALVVSEQQVYRGYLGEDVDADRLNTYVAVRNKTTGKMRLIQVETCTMLHSCYDEADERKFQNASDEVDLTMQRKFAGKAGLRALDRMARSGSNLDVLNETIHDSVQTFDDERFEEDNQFAKGKLERELMLASIKPPRNPKAQTPAELYQIEDMVSEVVLRQLKTVALDLMQKDPETLSMANIYLTNKVKAALQSKEPDSEENIEVIITCLVMDALCHLIELRSRSLTLAKLSTFSKELDAELKRTFAQANHHKQLKTKHTEHKALSHYLALAFALEKCVLLVDQIHAGLNIPKNDLVKFAVFIGGTYNSTKNTLTLRMTDDSEGKNSLGRSFVGKRRFGRGKK